jgi:hypothetical protein
MLVRVMENETGRVRSLARAWGVMRPGASMRELVAAIEAAYRREVEDDARRAMHRRLIAQMRAPA